MKYILLSLVLYFYHFMTFGKVRCSNYIPKKKFNFKNNEDKIDSLKDHNKESTYMCLNNKSLTLLSSGILNFKKLEKLYLKYNKFTEIPAVLYEIKTLIVLDMVNNLFKDFPNNVVLDNLKRLYLGNNEITFKELSFNEDNILNLDKIYPKLETLDLSHNKIEYLPILQSKSLKQLNLYDNEIKNINSKMFIGLEKLEFLRLPYNNLRKINNDICELKNLENIDLSGNKINSFIFKKGCLKNLRFLYLDYNQITEFKLEQYIVPQIEKLSLNRNILSNIPSNIYSLISLKELYLFGNEITTIHDLISNLINLTILDLSCNKISKIPKSISKLTNLETLKISFEHLEKEYVPQCVIGIISDDEYCHMTYEKYIESERYDSKVVDNISKDG